MVNHEDNDKIIGISKHIEDIRKQIKIAARNDSSVLIQGPTGTGKELIAKNIHYESRRKREMFEVVNCGAIPSELFESELFGIVRGAFTGAMKDKDGKVKLANKGTLFLDEIGDLRLDHQVKILRFIQDGSYSPVGGKNTNVNVRIIAATNKELLKEIRTGSFREDLYFRLYEHGIHTLPLVKRPEDVICLVNFFSTKGKLTEEDFKIRLLLYTYDFLGNVRELKNVFTVYDHTTIASKLWRSISVRVGRDASLPLGFDPEDYQPVSFNKTNYKLPSFPPTKEEYAQQEYNKFKRALHLIANNSQAVKKHVRAYEIIKLYQKTRLSKSAIAEILKIRVDKLSPSKFKSIFGFEFPDKNKPYLIDSPIDIYPSPKKSDYPLGDNY